MLTPPFDPARPDLCIVGAGTAGHALALGAAALGLRCTVVDPRTRLGAGQAADLAESLVFAAAAGTRAGGSEGWHAIRRRAGLAVARTAPEHAAARLRSLGVAVVAAQPRFADRRTLEAGGLAIRARRFVLATGRTDRAVGREGGALTPRHLLSSALPDRLTVATELPRGVEWAQALARFGTQVTLLATPRVLAEYDPELIAFATAGLRRDGVEVLLDDGAAEAAARDGPTLRFGAGRPATSDLDLARAGVELDGRGSPVVDGRLRTTNARMFALGDVLGPAARQRVEAEVGFLLRSLATGLPTAFDPVAVPVVLRTVPPVAQAGSLDAPRLWRATVPGPGDGLVKLATDRRGRIAGAGLVGDGAAEAVGAATLAAARSLPVGALASLAATGPASDALRRAALAAVAERLRRPAVRRLLAMLQRLP